MFTSGRANVLLKYKGNFRMICYKQPKLVLDFFSLKVLGFPSVLVSSFHENPYLSDDNPPLNKKSTKQSSNPQYVKSMYKMTKITDVLQQLDANATQELITTVIHKMYYMINEKPLTMKILKEIRFHPQFNMLTQLITVNDLRYEDLTILIKLLEKLQLPYSHDLYNKVLSKIVEIHKKLDFHELVEIHYFVKEQYKWKFDASNMLISLLQTEITSMLEDRYFLIDSKNKTAALQFSFYNPVSAEIQEIISCILSDLKPEEVLSVFRFFCKFLSETPSTHSSYKIVRENFFQILDKNLTECLPLSLVTNFAYSYALEKRNHNLNFDPELADYLMNIAVKFEAKNYELFQILRSSSLMKYVNYNLLGYAINVVKTEPNFAKDYPLCLTVLISVLANSNCSHENKERWNKSVNFLADSVTLTDCFDYMKTLPTKDYLFVVIELASLGIFHEESLHYLSRRVNISDVQQNGIQYAYMLLILNEAIKVLLPSFERSFLEIRTLKFIMKKCRDYNSKHLIKKLNTLHEVKESFDSVLRAKDTMFMEVYTKLGNFVHGVVAISNDGKAFNLESKAESHNINYIEEILVPVNYKIYAVFHFDNKEYYENSLSLIASRTLLLRTLEAMGFWTLFILDGVWKSLDGEQREEALKKEIFSKNRELFSDTDSLQLKKLKDILRKNG